MPSAPLPVPIAKTARCGSAREAALCLGAVLWAVLVFLARQCPPDGREKALLAQCLGRFHPLLVHFPIALLVLVPVLECAGRNEARAALRQAAGWVLALAALTALAAAFDGWLLAWSGGYRSHAVTNHLWSGVELAGACLAAAWARGRRSGPRLAYPLLLTGAVALMVCAAHSGGSLTHGEGFLTDKIPHKIRAWVGLPPVPSAPAAASGPSGPRASGLHAGLKSVDPSDPAYYSVHVAPVLERSCVSCHRSEKHKGGLRLDSYEELMLGGEDGPVVVPGDPKKSDLVRRLLLPPGDDDSMPSDGDKPLTSEEIQMLEHWIAAGAKSG